MINKFKATNKRIPIYYQGLKRLQRLNIERVKSSELADYLNIQSSTIRRDFSMLGELGKQGYGYDVNYLVDIFSKELGIKNQSAILIGVGNLGMSLLNYDFGNDFDITITKAYDTNDLIVGKEINGVKVEKLVENGCSLYDEADIAIVAVNSSEAKEVVEKLKKCHVKGILNFTSERFSSTNQTTIHNIDISGELLVLTYHVNRMGDK